MSCNKYIIKDGKPGKDGLSAYEIAVKHGFLGTEEEWLNSLKGDQGPMGLRGLPGQDGVNGSDGQDGQSSFTSYVFTRQQDSSEPSTPTGGSFQNPLPDQSEWTDGVPLGQGPIYMSYRIFTSDGLAPQQPVWSNPVLAADSALIDFEWSSVEVSPGNPTDNPSNWTNQASQTSIWMAIRTLSNGEWSDWNVIRIKGEKGDTGQSGLFTSTIYAINGSWIDSPPLDRSERFPAGWVTQIDTPVTTGQYVWWSQALIDPLTNQLVDQWTTPVRMSGEKGEQGQAGASITYRGDYDDEKQYKGSPVAIDFVIYDNGTSKDGYLARTDAGDIPIGTLPTDTDYWNGPIENVDALFTDFLIAYSAYIQNLIVGNLRTNTAGERIEILEGENKFKFYKSLDTDPSLEVGTFDIVLKTPLPQPDPQPTETVAGLISKDSSSTVPKALLSNEGLIINQDNPKLSAFVLQITGAPVVSRFVLYAGATFLGPGPSAPEKVAAAFESIYIHDPIRVWGYSSGGSGEMKYGFTGTHNGMEYINGVAIGPV